MSDKFCLTTSFPPVFVFSRRQICLKNSYKKQEHPSTASTTEKFFPLSISEKRTFELCASDSGCGGLWKGKLQSDE